MYAVKPTYWARDVGYIPTYVELSKSLLHQEIITG